jgi:hypothetical protein
VDSLFAWHGAASTIWPTRPVLGTAEALVATGDLALIRDDSLRTAVTAYLDDLRRLMAVHDDNTLAWFESAATLSAHSGRAAELEASEPPEVRDSLARNDPLWPLPAGPRRDPFPFDVEHFLTNRAAYQAIVEMSMMKENMGILRRMMRQRAGRLRARVEAAFEA